MTNKKIAWEGNSLEVLRGFPDNIRQDIGSDLRRLQIGEEPIDSRPMKAIGQGIYELRDRDEKTWYRVIYYVKIKYSIHVLHSFIKKSGNTPKKDLDIARERLRSLKQRMQEEMKDAKKKKNNK